MDLIKTVVEYTKKEEAPESFFYWSLLTAISAVVKKNVWTMRYHQFGGPKKFYANIYTMLVTESAGRKGGPIGIARDIVNGVGNNKVISGRTTIPGIIDAIAKTTTSKNNPEPIKGGTGLLVASEFASFIVENPVEALTILTDMYDTHHHDKHGWDYNLKHNPVHLDNLHLSMLSGSNTSQLKVALPPNAITGGFLGRTFLIQDKMRAIPNPGTSELESYIELDEIIIQAKKLALLNGPFSWNKEGEKLYGEFYVKNYANQIKLEDNTGTGNRLGDAVLKTAMLISLARDHNLVLEEDDVHDAISSCASFSKTAHQITLGSTSSIKSANAEMLGIVLKTIYDTVGCRINRPALLRKVSWHSIDTFELDRVIANLEAMKLARSDVIGGSTFITLTKMGIETLDNIAQKEE